MESATAGEKPKAKRGRKQDNSLPPSRSRDMQRAFRARKAEHLAQLEAKVARLEAENNELRAQLGMAARPPTPPPSTEGGAIPTPVAGRAASPSESASSVNGKMEEGGTPSEMGGERGGRPSSQSPAPSVSPGWRPRPMDMPLAPQQQQLPSPNRHRPHSNGAVAQWGGAVGYPQQPPQHDLAMLADLATHPQPYPPPGPYPGQPHPSHYNNGNYPYPQTSYSQQHSVLAYPPSQPSPSFPYPAARLPPMSMPTDTGSPSSFRPSHQASFTRSEPPSAPTPPNPCRPDSLACPPSACAPAQNPSESSKTNCGPNSGACGLSKAVCGPLKPISASLAPPAARGPLPSIQTFFEASGQPENLPDLDLSPLAALGTYIRPHPLRPPTPDPTLVDRFLETYARLASTAPGAAAHPSPTPPSPAYRLFLITLLRGLELTGKGPCERESFTPEEEMQLNTPPGEECCGGIVDCTGSLFEEQVFYDSEARPMMKDGWFSCSAAWDELVEFCDEDSVEVKKEEDVEEERGLKRQRHSLESSSNSQFRQHSPSFLANLVLEHMSPTSSFSSTGRVDTLVSRNIRCEATLGFMVKQSAVAGVKSELEARARGETIGAMEADGNVKTEPRQFQLLSSFQQQSSPHDLRPSFSPSQTLQQTNGYGSAPRKARC